MAGDSWLDLVIILSGILLSAFFSSAETAVSSLGELKLKQMIQVKGNAANILKLLIEHPNKVYNTLFLGNVLSNTGSAVFAGFFAYELYGMAGGIMSVFVMTFVILTFGEIIPKTIARNNPSLLIIPFTYIIKPFFYLFYPISFFYFKLTSFVLGMLGTTQTDSITEDDIAFMIEEQGMMEEQKQQMLVKIFDISDIQAREVMVPRTEMVAVPLDFTKDELMAVLKEYEYSRFPVYENTFDNIVGILHIKDLLKLPENWTVEEFLKTAHDAMFVPETKKIDILLKEFQQSRQQMAVVVDEYGGVAGIITMEDVLEEIVGEIRDEYDLDEKESEVQVIADGHYRIDARMNIDDFCDYFFVERTEDMSEYDTVAGLVYDIAESIPSVGERFYWNGYIIEIHSMTSNKLDNVDFIREYSVDDDTKYEEDRAIAK